MFIKFQIILKIAASRQVPVFQDGSPAHLHHPQTEQGSRLQGTFFHFLSDPAAPVSGESYLITTRFYILFTR